MDNTELASYNKYERSNLRMALITKNCFFLVEGDRL